MKKALLAAISMLILILDTKTALLGAAQGLELCLEVLVPSLFPFFVASILLSSSLVGSQMPFLRPLGRLLRLPEGAEYLLLLSLSGGYPTGAQSIAISHRAGQLSDGDARRLMAFCSNAGPSFLFGLGARLFPEIWICWALWGIHLLSAFLVGLLTPNAEGNGFTPLKAPAITLPGALKSAVEVMALVGGWVILFKILLAFADRWFLWLLPKELQALFIGLLELSNGCWGLTELPNLGLRILLCSGFLGFGGLCVALQTQSITGAVDTSLYLPGKLTQAAISILLCIPLQQLLPVQERFTMPMWSTLCCAAIVLIYGLFLRKSKITVAFPRQLMYNKKK